LKRAKSPSFIQEFELLEPKRGGFKQIDQVEDFSRRLFNTVLGKQKKKVVQTKSSKEWHQARELPKGSPAQYEAFITR
jgi:hypothetical protein